MSARAAGARQRPLAGDEAIWHDLECGAYTADLGLWHELVADARRRTGAAADVLELGCGTGRVGLALAGGGCRVTAVDIDAALVGVLRRRARERAIAIDALVADARSLDLDSSFDLALAPMQVAQLLEADGRAAMLRSVARHLRPAARVAVALLDLDEEWDVGAGPLPPPDELEADGCTYSSQPVAVRRTGGGRSLRLDRIRRVSSPDGGRTETFSRTTLELIAPEQLESEARGTGLVPDGRRQIPATDAHVASTVVILRAARG